MEDHAGPIAGPSSHCKPLSQSFWGMGSTAVSFELFFSSAGRGEKNVQASTSQSVWVVVKFRACEQPRALFLFTHLFPDSPPPMLNMLPCPGSVSVQLLPRMLSFPHLQSFFGSRTILLGKH